MANPYNPSQPADPVRAFAGREEELGRIRSCVAATMDGTVRNVFVEGEWGIGKTSLLFKLRPEFQEHGPVINEVLSERRDPDDQAAWFYNAVFGELLEANTVGVTAEQVENRDIRDQRLVRKLLMTVWEGLRDQFKIVVVMLDEVERATPGFLSGVRDVFQRLAQDGARYMLVFAGRRLPVEGSDAADPIGRFFQPKIELRPFDEASSLEAIRKPIQFGPLKFSDDAARLIHERAAGHPYFLKSICSEVFESVGGNGEVDALRLEKLWPDIEERLARDKFGGSFAGIPEGEQVTILHASLLGPRFEIKELRTRIPKSVDTFVKRLLERELIRPVSRGVYEIYHPLFRSYLQSKAREREIAPTRISVPVGRPLLGREEIEAILRKADQKVDVLDQHFRDRAVSMLEAVGPGVRVRVLMGEDPAWSKTQRLLQDLDEGLRRRIEVRAWPDKTEGKPVPWHYRCLIGDREMWAFDHSLSGAGKKQAYLMQVTDEAEISEHRQNFERWWQVSKRIFPE
ncbi:MAG: AAA family ATPase [bacterium]